MEKIQSQSEEIFDILLRDALIAKYKDEADRFCKLSAEFESTKIFEKNIIKIRHSVNRKKYCDRYRIRHKPYICRIDDSACRICGS